MTKNYREHGLQEIHEEVQLRGGKRWAKRRGVCLRIFDVGSEGNGTPKVNQSRIPSVTVLYHSPLTPLMFTIKGRRSRVLDRVRHKTDSRIGDRHRETSKTFSWKVRRLLGFRKYNGKETRDVG